MKFIIDKAAIGAAAVMLQKVINPKNSLPILSDIFFDVHDQQLTMTASDSEVTLTVNIDLNEMDGTGQFCVPAAELLAALSPLTVQPLTFTLDETYMLKIEHQTGYCSFMAESADEWPLPMAPEFVHHMAIDGSELANALKRGLWATKEDDLRPVFSGVYLRVTEDETFDVVCTNGHALIISEIMTPDDLKPLKDVGIIIPKRAALVMSAMPMADNVEVEVGDTEGEIKSENYTLRFRQITGKYPNYLSVIPPQDTAKIGFIDRAMMMYGLRMVSPFTPDSSNMVQMHFEKDKLTLTGTDVDFSKGATIDLEMEYKNEPITIGAKAQTLLTILSKMKEEQVEVRLFGPDKCIILEPEEQPEKCDITMLTMPMIIC